MMAVLVREIQPTDIPELMEILGRTPEAGAWSAGDLQASSRCCLVAEQAGRRVGLLLAQCPTEDEAEVLTLAVEPQARRQGIGGALVREFLGRRQGHVFLEVRPSNHAAQRLYQSCGFQSAGVRPRYYQEPEEDALLLQWRSPSSVAGGGGL